MVVQLSVVDYRLSLSAGAVARAMHKADRGFPTSIAVQSTTWSRDLAQAVSKWIYSIIDAFYEFICAQQVIMFSLCCYAIK